MTTSALEQDNVGMRATSRTIKNNTADQNTDQNHEDDSEDKKNIAFSPSFTKTSEAFKGS